MNDEKLELLVKYEKKNLFWGRLRAILAAVLALTLVVGVVIVAVEVKSFNKTVDDFKAEVSEEIKALDMENVNGAVVSLTGAANELASLDTDSINKLVQSLENVATSLSNVTNGLKKIFGK